VSRALALELLGDSVSDPAEVANIIAGESGGSPLFISELVRAFSRCRSGRTPMHYAATWPARASSEEG